MPTEVAVIFSGILVGISLFFFWGSLSIGREADQYRRDYKKHNKFWYFLSALTMTMGIAFLVCAGIILSDPGLQDRRKEECHSLGGVYSNGQCWSEEIELEN